MYVCTFRHDHKTHFTSSPRSTTITTSSTSHRKRIRQHIRYQLIASAVNLSKTYHSRRIRRRSLCRKCCVQYSVPLSNNAIMGRFYTYLQTIPFRFANTNSTSLGRTLRTEADVRTFLNSSIIVPCWPVCLTMIPEIGNTDLIPRCESDPVEERTSLLHLLCK